jgi:hypothetical protein
LLRGVGSTRQFAFNFDLEYERTLSVKRIGYSTSVLMSKVTMHAELPVTQKLRLLSSVAKSAKPPLQQVLEVISKPRHLQSPCQKKPEELNSGCMRVVTSPLEREASSDPPSLTKSSQAYITTKLRIAYGCSLAVCTKSTRSWSGGKSVRCLVIIRADDETPPYGCQFLEICATGRFDYPNSLGAHVSRGVSCPYDGSQLLILEFCRIH